MKHYLVGQITITDQERYRQYESGFMEILMAHEGKLLAVDDEFKTVEGTRSASRAVILEFENEEKALAWYHSDEYQTLAQHRFASSEANISMVRGLV